MKTITRHIALASILVLVVLCIGVSYFFMLSPSSYLSPRYAELGRQCTTCANAQKLAATHFAEGKYQIIHWGLMDMDSPSLKIATILQRDFGITTVFGGCVSPPNLVCYDNKMRNLLVSRYGVTFYQSARKEALLLS
jgi:hypothetical protein